jgi:hypothetical protein
MKKSILALIASLLFVFTSQVILAGGSPEDSGEGIHIDSKGVAARGADVVAYFSLPADAPAVKGSVEYAYQWRGATWLFSTMENRDAFASEPDRYAPAFGGYCAWAMARDKLATIDPDRWAVVEGTLYLNYSKRTHGDWEKEREENIRKAAANWPGQVDKLTVDD